MKPPVVSSGNLVYDANLAREQVVWGGDMHEVLGCAPEQIAQHLRLDGARASG